MFVPNWGVTLSHTKCHPEMAGEGIEYLWGFMKRKYRRNWSARDAHRQSTKDFTDLVEFT